MKVRRSYSNFARAQIDRDMNGRFDLPIYSSSAEVFENFISNFKGNGIYRTGLENILEFQDCAFIEFKFSQNQNYILVLYANKMRFLSYDGAGNFGWVLNPSPTIFEVDTPWSLAEAKEIAFKKSYTQNFDSMILTHPSHEPQELTRLAADDFKLQGFARKNDPFPLTFGATQTITGITQATEAVITITGHPYAVGDRVKITGVGGMTEINDWTVYITATTTNTITVDLDTTDFTAYTSGGTAEEVLTGDYPAVCLYYSGRLYYAATPAKITTIFGSESGQFKIHTLPTTVLAESALQFTLAEFSSDIEWLFAGQNSLIAGSNTLIAAINGGTVDEPITAESIEVTPTSADGCNSVEPLTKDGYIFYVSNDSRKLFYFTYDLLTETFVAEDANVISYDITNSGMKKIRDLKTKQDLVFGLKENGDLVSVNFKFQKENIIGWHVHKTNGTVQDIAQISDNDGQQQLFTLTLRDGSYYIERKAEYPEFSRREDFDTGDEDADDEAHYRLTAEELKDCIHLDNAGTTSNLQSTTITYDSGAGTITDGTGPFSSSDVGKQIAYKTKTGYESGRFEITAFNSSTSVDVDVLITPTANTYDSWYLTFDTISGLTRFNGNEVAVVADGKFIDTFTVSGGQIVLDEQVTSVVVGYLFKGVIKSFTLGFQVQTENTQATMKNIGQVGFRLVDSAGGRFGTSRYDLEPIQDLQEGDLNYLPPPLINETKFIEDLGESDKDKAFYLIQDVPLPMVTTSVIIDAEYAVTR